MTKYTVVLAAGLGLLFSGVASATTFSFHNPDPSGSEGAGDIKDFNVSYNDVSEVLTWSTTVEEKNGNLANGFWMVLSDGPNPKGGFNEYAIMYGDGLTGELNTYLYNGANASNSWSNPGEHIETFVDVLTMDTSVAGQHTFDFSIDATNVNNHVPLFPGIDEYTGISFGNMVGIWFHAVVFSGSGATYNPNGTLASFDFNKQSWYDASNDLTVVPVPAAAWLFGTALMGLFGLKRRKVSI